MQHVHINNRFTIFGDAAQFPETYPNTHPIEVSDVIEHNGYYWIEDGVDCTTDGDCRDAWVTTGDDDGLTTDCHGTYYNEPPLDV